MNVHAIYQGSNGDQTKALYEKLDAIGPAGAIAVNLFRAQKCSARAKTYRRRYKGEAYDRKQWSMANLCVILHEHAPAYGITWGWKEDPKQEFHKWVLYVDLPTGQVSFHTSVRGQGPDYPGDWDRQLEASPGRIIAWINQLLGEPGPVHVITTPQPPPIPAPSLLQPSLFA